MTPQEVEQPAAQVAALREALKAWLWADANKGVPAGDSPNSLNASAAAIARANAELWEKARALSHTALADTPSSAPSETGGSKMVCEVCGTNIGAVVERHQRCTNQRCGYCHRRYCTPGGDTEPGHGRGDIATPFSPEAIAKSVTPE